MKSISAVRDDAPRLSARLARARDLLAGTTSARWANGDRRAAAAPALDQGAAEEGLHKSAAANSSRASSRAILRRRAGRACRIASPHRSGSFQPFLLHGVTGSGKTEVYLHLIARLLERGLQALVLVPEISLNRPSSKRASRGLPEARLALLHSGLQDIARTSPGWMRREAKPASVLGTRLRGAGADSRLALIVVDERHDTSFKQQEGLRYSARDAAIYRAKLAGCPVILGSATPSLESWHNYQNRPLRAARAPGARGAGARLPAGASSTCSASRRGRASRPRCSPRSASAWRRKSKA